jgi:hypothetical protein
MAEHRAKASAAATRPVGRVAAAAIIIVWIIAAAVVGWLVLRYFGLRPN